MISTVQTDLTKQTAEYLPQSRSAQTTKIGNLLIGGY